ncbi:LURP-one-related family protein [Sphingobacterium bovistauri]|uniref:LURP-one-related family protein n=1 Tax=Sphingobacterium bovistauri TaxID=2781959 RepID=A0ABS7Z415_9SPHI|nr:LURP-one-related family protein [Sphingobacterium bovistauri]MCA5004897.1 LURP-one-related family protein [Sphingobacterium bovistauri]
MSQYNYPLHFKFRISTFSNDFEATDSLGNTLFYVREKILTWRDQMKVYSNGTKDELLYEIKSNKLIDFQQTFAITNSQGDMVGKVRRKTISSLWKSTFKVMDASDSHDYTIKEKNAFVKMWDGVFGEIPIIGMLSGYVFNPSYILSSTAGEPLFELKKEPSFFGRKFTVDKLTSNDVDEERLILSLVVMVLIERSRG